MRSQYSDGDLYINMRGHGPGPRLDASHALGSLLRSLDVPPERIPDDLDGRAALYRSRLDGKRILVVIDDATTADQVCSLLPASPTCLVLVTSRSTLPGLVAREGAQRMSLDTLTAEESLALLREHIGAQRIVAKPEAARALVAHCDHLPLALRIVAERLIDRPDTPIGDVVAELGAEDERLDSLGTSGDELSNLRAVFGASYSALPIDAARLFRILGVHPGAEFSPASCAAAVGLPSRKSRPLLGQLAGTNLLQRVGHDRYRLHDLLRVYAAERFYTEEPSERETEVIDRLARWYLASGRSAVRVIAPNFRTVADPEGPSPADPLTFDTTHSALLWFEQERLTLVSTLRAAADHELHDLAWRLPAAIYGLFERHRHWHEWREIHLVGLDAARRLGHHYGQSRNLLGLADSQWRLRDIDQALENYTAALGAAREAGDGWTEGFALRQRGQLRWERDQDSEAPALVREGIEAFHESGERRGEGMALLSLADYERSLGHHDMAQDHCHTALAIFTEIADTWSTAWARCFLADALVSSGGPAEAIEQYQTAVAVFYEVENRYTEAVARIGLGRAHAALGDTTRARTHLGAALDLLRSVDDPRADEVETEMAQLP